MALQLNMKQTSNFTFRANTKILSCKIGLCILGQSSFLNAISINNLARVTITLPFVLVHNLLQALSVSVKLCVLFSQFFYYV